MADLQMILQELRVTGPKPPLESLPQTIVVKCSSFKTKEVLKLARQRKRFVHQERMTAPGRSSERGPNTQRKKQVLKNKLLPTPFPAKLRVSYEEETCVYN